MAFQLLATISFLLTAVLTCPAACAQIELSPIRLAESLPDPVPTNQNGTTAHAFQMWTPVYIDFPMSRGKKLRGYFEASPRLGNNLNGMSQLLIRQAIGYRISKHTSAYVGHVWVSNYPDHTHEQRIFQQFGVGHVLFKRLEVLHRTRLEERFIQNTNGACSMRARYLLRFALPLKWRLYAVVSDELFVNLNSVENGPLRGIDQNRLYAGIGRQMSNQVRMEVGYQQQYVNASDPTDDRANHILMTQLFLAP
ncbi:MAG: DUF2490 domain-containing protein [Candidatus Obscuribacterales bacterium]|nr:DUF2490 domain-containing protein [Candidatus Obscuribacterales bacterium]